MKTLHYISKSILGAAVTFALVMSAIMPLSLKAADEKKAMAPMKGGEHLSMLQGINTKQEAEALKPEDTMAMVCSKCKTVWVSRVKQGMKGAQILNEHGVGADLIGTHACKGCGSTLTVTGHAKGDITELKHSCKVCGDGSAFCCATKAGSGATKGMQPK
jgi:hypothetical protein